MARQERDAMRHERFEVETRLAWSNATCKSPIRGTFHTGRGRAHERGEERNRSWNESIRPQQQ